MVGLYDFVSRYSKNDGSYKQSIEISNSLRRLLLLQGYYTAGAIFIYGYSEDNGVFSASSLLDRINILSPVTPDEEAPLKIAMTNVKSSKILDSFVKLFREAEIALLGATTKSPSISAFFGINEGFSGPNEGTARIKVSNMPTDFILFKLFMKQLQYVAEKVIYKKKFPTPDEIKNSDAAYYADQTLFPDDPPVFQSIPCGRIIDDILVSKLVILNDKLIEIENSLNTFYDKVLDPKTGTLGSIKSDILSLNLDPEDIRALLSDGQLSLLYNRLNTILEYSIYPTTQVKILDNANIKTTWAKSAIFNLDSQNLGKRTLFEKFDILTVGLLRNFYEFFRSRFKIAKGSPKSFNQKRSKQIDVFKLVVLKTDELYPEINFKPMEFLFDFSILPNYSHNGPDVNDVMLYDPENLTLVFDPYSQIFDNQLDFDSMIFNHKVSYLLGLYITVLTGIEMNEHSLYTVNNIINNKINRANSNITNLIKDNLSSLDSNLIQASSSLIRSITTVSDTDVIKDYALRPRAFDRIYNLVVPKKFEILNANSLIDKSILDISEGGIAYVKENLPSVSQYQVYVKSINDYNK
jgi:hypothetical protein